MRTTSRRPTTYEEALSKTTALCSGSEYCIHQIREKMEKWQVAPADMDRVIDYLLDERYIDEARFCRAYCHDKLRYNHWGRIKISQMLRLMHLDKIDIQEGIDSIDEDEYTAILEALIKAKLPSIKANSDYERNGKLIRFALSRGFEMDLICRLVKQEE